MLGSKRLKRGIDLLGSATALVATAPVMLASAAAIRLSMGSPVLFTQVRAGEGGQPFEIVKFRTMRPPREGEDEVASDSQRTPPIGRFLRKTSLDELPTLLNVLKGDMSLVGPRPLLIRYLERYSPRQFRRHEVKPGITGWAQVNGRNSISWEDKFELDLWYVENHSLLLDARTLLLTFKKVLQREGVDSGAGVTMTEFMGSKNEE